MTAVIARWRPNRSAASLPRMLAGIASSVTSTLTATGASSAEPPLCATTKVQNATIQVRMP